MRLGRFQRSASLGLVAATGVLCIVTSLPGSASAVRRSASVTGPPSLCADGDGLYPSSLAAKFWHCDNNVAYLKDCPSGLHWNDRRKECDWPEDALAEDEDIGDGLFDSTGAGPSGEQPHAADRPSAGYRASMSAIGLGGSITYRVVIVAPKAHTSARIRIRFPTATMIWVAGQDCFHDGGGVVDCLVFPPADHFSASVFTLRAKPLALGPMSVTAHFAASSPRDSRTVPDRSLTCTALTGAVVVC